MARDVTARLVRFAKHHGPSFDATIPGTTRRIQRQLVRQLRLQNDFTPRNSPPRPNQHQHHPKTPPHIKRVVPSWLHPGGSCNHFHPLRTPSCTLVVKSPTHLCVTPPSRPGPIESSHPTVEWSRAVLFGGSLREF